MIIGRLVAGALATLLVGTIPAQTICPPQIRWHQTFGTSLPDEGRRVLPLTDGGFVIAGDAFDSSGLPGNKTSPGYGSRDFWLIRLDANGQKLWEQSYGGVSSDELRVLEQMPDGGFILGGVSWSSFGGNKTATNYGGGDFWIVRVDASGNKLWDRSFGGLAYDDLQAIKVLSDGFLIGGNSSSSSFGGYDFLVFRLDANGNQLWQDNFGGGDNESLATIHQTPDGGFLLGGTSDSDMSGTKDAPTYGFRDYWLVRLDTNGMRLWDRSYGGAASDQLRAVLLAPNGDILLAGDSQSGVSGKKTVPNFGYNNYWLIRTDETGAVLWDKVYGGHDSEYLGDAMWTPAGDLLFAGSSYSSPSGTKTSRLIGWSDFWLVKIDATGNQLWDGSYGGTRNDDAYGLAMTSDGGSILVGNSNSMNGDKGEPHFGYSDIWVVRFNPENPADCDNDGVPNAQDLCGGTRSGALVNTNGCSIEQICPCDAWTSHEDYYACVEQTSAQFELAGIITSAQRTDLLVDAQEADCPRIRILFGIKHLLNSDTVFGSTFDEGPPTFYPGTNPTYNVTVLLGEADSGVFIDPTAGPWGYGNPAWFLEGKAFGRLRSGSNSLVATIRGTKPEAEYYPVELDFSALGPESLTFQFYSNHVVLTEETNPGPVGSFVVSTSSFLGPRVNPFWRMADGSVGALIEFTSVVEPNPEFGRPNYNRVFIRANNPTQQVDYISHFEVTGGGGLDSFSFHDERLGMFGNRHRIVGGPTLFEAMNRQLTLIRREAGSHFGTTIETDATSHFDLDLLPINPATNSSILIAAFGQTLGGGYVYLSTAFDLMEVGADFNSAWIPGESNIITGTLEIEVFRNGVLSGSCSGANDTVLGHFVLTNEQPVRIIGYTAIAATNLSQSIAFSTDQVIALKCTNGTEILGNHFRVAPVSPDHVPPNITLMNVVMNHPSGSFTITAERSQTAEPRLSITLTSTQVILSWPDNTRLFRLESSPSLPGGFAPVAEEPMFVDNRNVLSLPRANTRFFRLRKP